MLVPHSEAEASSQMALLSAMPASCPRFPGAQAFSSSAGCVIKIILAAFFALVIHHAHGDPFNANC
jgi:hypothetical protein